MLDVVVKGLDDLESIIPAAQASGARHAEYGVKDEDYTTVADALIWTLSQGLGDDFDGELKQAWTAAYVVLSSTMKDAAKVTVA